MNIQPINYWFESLKNQVVGLDELTVNTQPEIFKVEIVMKGTVEACTYVKRVLEENKLAHIFLKFNHK
ncbi:hypothetical protein [Brevibacillus laterosporus]|uniref:hypothetical protein n=1 Tax=Brevibacillus laterosporus TaxID=1465 RepID=UPI00264FAB57|nr:hypothetical protein [Brevibacillus laterosporus]MDN9011071.1 hypothetical protein [Brevibacillus laterosporus]MDO0942094.1 hypothetical protein [Brevibacillus laterosporus]